MLIVPFVVIFAVVLGFTALLFTGGASHSLRSLVVDSKRAVEEGGEG